MNLAKLMNQAQQMRTELAAKQEADAQQTVESTVGGEKVAVVDPSGDLLSRMSPNENILDYKRHQIETKTIPQNQQWLFWPLPLTQSEVYWRGFIKGFFDQDGVNVLREFYSPEDVELITTFGRWLNALHYGYDKSSDERMVIKPENEIEEHFALVSHGRKTPLHHFEKVWLSFHADQEFLRLVKSEKYGDSPWSHILSEYLKHSNRGNQAAKKWVEDHGGRDEILAQIRDSSIHEGMLGVYYHDKQVRG